MEKPQVKLITDPSNLPDLSSESEIGFDIETFDPELKTKGPGPRRSGYLTGFSVATPTRTFFVPVKHSGVNMSEDAARNWVSRQIFRPGLRKVGHNILYDLDFAQYFVDSPSIVHNGGPYECTYMNEHLLDERKSTVKSLDACALRHLGIGKVDGDLVELARDKYGIKEKNVKANLWRLSGEDISEYAGTDAWLTLKLAHKQREYLKEQELLGVQDLECRLLPLLTAMRSNGVRIDVPGLTLAKERVQLELDTLNKSIFNICGENVAPWEAAQIARICDRLSIDYLRTFKTNAPSFTKEFLEVSEHPFLQALKRIRILDKVIGTFLEGQLTSYLIGDRIHPLFVPEGTVTGRFSSEHPNAQNFPARDDELSSIVRGVFIPEDGCSWIRADYSQVEYRMLVHYASGDGAVEAREKYNNDRTMSYHLFTQMLLKEVVGLDVPYKSVKNLNFGLIYGQGIKKTARVLGLDEKEAKALQAKYHSAIPFARQTMERASKKVNELGYVRTINWRRRRFDTWEPRGWSHKYDKNGKRRPALSEVEALEEYKESGIERALSYKALNACLQGSAGEVTKRAMVDIWESGICDVIGPPHLTVHDELDFSANLNDPKHLEATREVKHIMETSTKLRVPLYVEFEYGDNWGNLEPMKWN